MGANKERWLKFCTVCVRSRVCVFGQGMHSHHHHRHRTSPRAPRTRYMLKQRKAEKKWWKKEETNWNKETKNVGWRIHTEKERRRENARTNPYGISKGKNKKKTSGKKCQCVRWYVRQRVYVQREFWLNEAKIYVCIVKRKRTVKRRAKGGGKRKRGRGGGGGLRAVGQEWKTGKICHRFIDSHQQRTPEHWTRNVQEKKGSVSILAYRYVERIARETEESVKIYKRDE